MRIPNRGRSHFSHNFQSSYENLIHYQTEGSVLSSMNTEVLLNVLTNEITVVTKCWAHNPISFKHVSSRSPFSRSTSSHTSLKYRCLSKVCNWIRPAYLRVRFCEGVAWLMWIVFADDQKTSSVCPGGCNSWKCSVWLQHSDQQVWGGDQKGNWPLYHRSSEYTASGGIYNG